MAISLTPLSRRASRSPTFSSLFSSRNWPDRPYCRRELELFRQRWAGDDEFKNVRHRIVIARRHHVDEDDIPEFIRGQNGYEFFRYDGPKKIEHELPYFDNGATGRLRLSEERQRARRISVACGAPASSPVISDKDRIVEPPPPPPPPPADVPRNGRTIYLAKPARDMRRTYQRIHRELHESGFDVVPGMHDDVPLEGPAVEFIDEA